MFAKLTRTPARRFILGALASALALTSVGVTQARADERDVFRFIAGAAAVAIIADALSDDRGRVIVSRQNHGHIHGHQGQRPRVVTPHNPRVTPRPLPQHVRRQVLPSNCTLTARGRNGTRSYMGDKCLNKHGITLANLPRQCRTHLQGPRGGTWKAWDLACMTNRGYRTARR